jgi:hypothetical protein
MYKKRFLGILVAAMFLLTNSSALAVQTLPLVDDPAQILKDFGFSDFEISHIDDIEYLAQTILTDPESISITRETTSIDEFSLMRECLYTPDSELLKKGYTNDQINIARDTARELLSMSTDELKQTGKNITSSQVKAQLGFDNGIMPMAISTTDLMTSLIVIKKAYSDYPVHYTVYFSFEWQDVPLLTLDDEIAVAWGGNLVANNYSSTFEYLYGVERNYASSVVESPINAGAKYYFPLRAASGTTTAIPLIRGVVSFELYQRSAAGLDSKVIAAYGHRILNILGPGISISTSGNGVLLSPSFSFGLGYDYSPQKQYIIGV